MNNHSSIFRKLPFRIAFISMIALSAFCLKAENAIDISEYLPLENKNYWSYVGDFDSDDLSTRLNLRDSLDSTLFVDDHRSYRMSQEVFPTREINQDSVDVLKKKVYQTSGNGWNIFREEGNNRVLDYKRSARVLPKQVEFGKSYKYKTTLDPDSGLFGVISYHTVIEGMEELHIPNGTFEVLRINQEKRTKLASDEKLKEITSSSTEYSTFWLAKGVGILKESSIISTVDNNGSSQFGYDIDLVATNYLDNYLWPEATSTESGWKHVTWFGYLTDNYFPWIYHHDHGWMWVEAQDSSDIKLWSESLGWWMTSEELYPTFYSLDLEEWLTYNEESETERKFVRSDGSILTASTSGFSFRPERSKPPQSNATSPLEKEGDQEFYDSRGNRYVDSNSGITSDQGELPEINILSPIEGSRVDEGQKFLILVDAFDKDGEIMQVRIFVNGRLVEISEAAPHHVFFTTTDEEVYNINATATDNDGNTVQSATVVVENDVANQLPPEVRVHEPLNKAIFKIDTWVDVEIKASDSDGFVESVALLVDGIQVGDAKQTPPYNFSFIPPVNGSYKIGARAVDDDENVTEAKEITITVNETGTDESSSKAPEVRIVSPLNKSIITLGQTISIEAVASDEDGMIDRVQILVDGIQVGNDLHSAPYRVSYTPPQTGTYSISARARDNDRKISTSASITLTVN
ncbi:MAG: Ig-like domain-containing protein [Opitutales bacterium]|nr:Ig-like domain-containing protein [Opitutales bacterium]